MRILVCGALAFFLLGAGVVRAVPDFEMADVHVSTHSDNPSLRVFHRGGRYELLGATMVDLVSAAYGVKPDAVAGGPGWVEMDRFDVITKAADDATAETLRPMLQALLAERFGLVVHKDSALRPVYVLTTGAQPRVKRSDGPGEGTCADQPAGHSAAINFVFGCRDITIAAFLEVLRKNAGGPIGGYLSNNEIVDLTELKGGWDFDVKWTGRGLLANTGSEGVTLFDAIDKQLGLKLASGKAPLPVVVVDSVNRKPTDNVPGVTQKLPELRLEFEVADIKLSTQEKPTAPKFTAGGRMEVKGVTLIALIQHAWGLDTYDNDLISGGPKWLESERFDILAKATPPEGPASSLKDDDSLRAMLRNMLVDRFKLAVHNEEKPVSVFALSADKPKLKQADPSGRSKCSEGAAAPTNQVTAGQRTITCTNTTASQFADWLRRLAPGYINRPVVDATGIDGAWDISVSYSRANLVRAEITPGDGQSAGSDPNGAISLFEALQKQLGLKLATEKRPMPALVIDHIERQPSDN